MRGNLHYMISALKYQAKHRKSTEQQSEVRSRNFLPPNFAQFALLEQWSNKPGFQKLLPVFRRKQFSTINRDMSQQYPEERS